MRSQLSFILVMLCLGVFSINMTAHSQETQKYNSFKTGGEWLDANGVHIDCHGGNIIYVEHLKTYYWYGEHRGEPRGASCYSSSDLYNWKKECVVMEKGAIEIFERPKVIYDEKNNRYVIWFHYDVNRYHNQGC